MNEAEGYFINVRIENIYIKMLIDTGASVTILRNDIYDNLLSKPKSESVRASLVNATGELSPFYGKAYIKLNIGGKPYEHNVLLADIQNEGILGIDFFKGK
jgi:predicted aspartyl protease